MSGSGGLTVGIVYLLYKRRLLQRFASLRYAMVAMIVLTVLLVFINVFITAQLMFISQHDLILTTALLIFAGLIAIISVVLIASSLIERLEQLGDAAQRVGRGELQTRIPVEGKDELSRLASLFNTMAQMLEDVDREKRLLEQSRRDLVAWASHDLRTPLASVRAMNEAMLDGVVADAETVRRYRQQIHSEIEHLGNLIDDLFELAQVDAGHLNFSLKRTALPELITRAVAGISARAAQGSVTVTSEIDPDLPPLMIAPDKIQRVLYNLLDNAIHHTPPNGQVKLTAQHVNGQVEISVHNSGSTIAPEDLTHVFERFYRSERSRARGSSGYRGTGLGLAIARSFVEAHGGSITVSSDPEQGTTFTFTLPLQDSA
jgi:signal transduction histidine kinase